jgi:hypothetical protein
MNQYRAMALPQVQLDSAHVMREESSASASLAKAQVWRQRIDGTLVREPSLVSCKTLHPCSS